MRTKLSIGLALLAVVIIALGIFSIGREDVEGAGDGPPHSLQGDG